MSTPEPFLRWAGGKRWLASSLAPLVRQRLGRGATYFEPFLGGGALFFAVLPARAILSDLNGQLVAAYRAVASRHTQVAAGLAGLSASRRRYYRVRRQRPTTQVEKAVRLIYLNHNCYAGLYRENRDGEFNVPYGGDGRDHRRVSRNGVLAGAASALKRKAVELWVSDFGAVIAQAGLGDVVYCDPTYREVTRTRFDRYGRTVFDWADQERLAEVALAASERGTLVLLSNGTSRRLRKLYPSAATIRLVRRKGLGVDGSRRNRTEYLFVLDPKRKWATWRQLGEVTTPSGRVLARST